METLPLKNLLLLLFMSTASTALAQRLVIESSQTSAAIKVIYGKLTETGFVFFESDVPLTPDDQELNFKSSLEANVETSVETSVETNVETSNEPTEERVVENTPKPSVQPLTFTMNQTEFKVCTKSPRFVGFRAIAKSLSPKITAISIAKSDDAGACHEKILKEIAKILPKLTIDISESSNDEIKISMNLLPLSNVQIAAKSQKPTETKTARRNKRSRSLSFSDIVKEAKLTFNDFEVAILEDGWFVREFDSNEEVEVQAFVPTFKPITLNLAPITMFKEPTQVAKSKLYQQRVAVTGSQKLRIYVTPIPLLDKKTSFDGGFGGGIGYGKEIPGERQGQRFMTNIGLEKREIFGSVGAKGTIMYTTASTVVPVTLTSRLSVFRDWSAFENSTTIRTGMGAEMFIAQIRSNKNKPVTEKSISIPNQVITPLFSLGLVQLVGQNIAIAPSLYVTPLYVRGFGFSPSFSPALETGVKLNKDWIVMAHLGIEVHRFPSNLGDNTLQLYYGLVSFRRTVFD